MSKTFDCTVIGIGGIGSAALYYAAQRGWRTLGLDRFRPGHAQGSSHGRTRIIRQAYFEHPNYVPLLKDAYQLWDEFQERVGEQLFHRTGLLQVGDPGGPIIGGICRSAAEHQLSLQEYDAASLRDAFPLFECRDGDVGLFEKNAGYLRVEACVRAFAGAARQLGAQVCHDNSVLDWTRSSNGFEIRTDSQTFRSRRLILTAGSWTSQLIPELAHYFQVVAKHQHWFHIADPRTHESHGCPTFFFETDGGCFYGFPDAEGRGTKIAEHTGGTPMAGPQELQREINADDLQRVQDFASQYLNTARGIHHDHSVCMYTMSPDGHFIVDLADEKLAYAGGLSGHGFKFAPLLGKSLVGMVDGILRPDMDFLQVRRFNGSVA